MSISLIIAISERKIKIFIGKFEDYFEQQDDFTAKSNIIYGFYIIIINLLATKQKGTIIILNILINQEKYKIENPLIIAIV